MKSKWPIVSLGDYCSKTGSGATPRGGSSVYLDDGDISLIRSQNVYNDGFKPDGLVYITEGAAQKLKNVIVEKNDVLLNITGDSVARVCLAKDEYLPARVNQHVAIIRPDVNEFDSRYLRYLLSSPTMQNLLLTIASAGATRNALTKNMIESLDVSKPPIDIQIEIANKLETLDNKIELNRQTNQTLEQIAQAIFKSWFVDFEPVKAKIAARKAFMEEHPEVTEEEIRAATAMDDVQDAQVSREAGMPGATGGSAGNAGAIATAMDGGSAGNAGAIASERAAMCAISGKLLEELEQLSVETQKQLKTTAALFPDALVESELGEMPDGWYVKDIKELASKISKGTTPRKADIQTAEDVKTIPFLKVRDISDDGEITRTGLDKVPESIHTGVLKRSMLETNDLLFSIAGTIGRVALVEEDLSNSNCNQAVAFIRLEEPDKYLELCRLNLVGSRVQNEVVSKVVQGVQANFSLTGLGEIKILIPSEELLASFNKILGGISKNQMLLLSENRKLSELRGVLLPKLLSGELMKDEIIPVEGMRYERREVV